MKVKEFCTYCGQKLINERIEGVKRAVCSSCENIHYDNPIPASAAVVFNDKGEILLVKRNCEPKAGMWCLPGGFIEVDETPDQGTIRELKEETGLDADTDILLDVIRSKSSIYKCVYLVGYLMKNVKGKIKPGFDADDVAYFSLKDKPELAFESHEYILKKAISMSIQFNKNILFNIGPYVITSKNHIDIANKACKAGAKIIQYRDKDCEKKEFLNNALKIRRITSKYNCLFIVNDYLDLALISGADGVHLGQDDIPVEKARIIVPPGFIIGVSTHSKKQALIAQKNGADYIGIGPVFKTPTKESYKPIGIKTVQQVLKSISIPVVAIGGLNPGNVNDLIKIGIKNFAMLRAFQKNTEQVTRKLNK